MAATPTATFITSDSYTVTLIGTIALTGNYGTASSHGDTLNLSGLAYQALTVPSNAAPLYVSIQETPAAGNIASGYLPGYAKGTTQANGSLTLMNGTTEMTEGSAYSATQLLNPLTFEAVFTTFV